MYTPQWIVLSYILTSVFIYMHKATVARTKVIKVVYHTKSIFGGHHSLCRHHLFTVIFWGQVDIKSFSNEFFFTIHHRFGDYLQNSWVAGHTHIRNSLPYGDSGPFLEKWEDSSRSTFRVPHLRCPVVSSSLIPWYWPPSAAPKHDFTFPRTFSRKEQKRSPSARVHPGAKQTGLRDPETKNRPSAPAAILSFQGPLIGSPPKRKGREGSPTQSPWSFHWVFVAVHFSQFFF